MIRRMQIPIYHVHAFTSERFSGNPAAVCPLEEWLPDAMLQRIASENAFSETAFYLDTPGAIPIRWFTPRKEVDLCGHATLATAFVIDYRRPPEEPAPSGVDFSSRSGLLSVARSGDQFTLDFPRQTPERCTSGLDLEDALGVEALEVLAAYDYVVVLESETAVRNVCPDMAKLAQNDKRGVIVTAPGDSCDFVSRFFAPALGVPEDPVTGSAHCCLAPYWAQQLGKPQLTAQQLSQRGGQLTCELKGDRVLISGGAVLYLEGTLHV